MATFREWKGKPQKIFARHIFNKRLISRTSAYYSIILYIIVYGYLLVEIIHSVFVYYLKQCGTEYICISVSVFLINYPEVDCRVMG